jgi:hypothetical protein
VQQGEDIALIGVEGSPTMGVWITSSDPARGGMPEWPEGTAEHASGEGIFIEELRRELGSRGITPRLSGETHALPDHEEAAQRTRISAALDGAAQPGEGP